MKKLQKVGIVTGVILVVLVGLYLMAVYSNIPFIKKYRTLYIETAMSTLEHQWLATAFIPKSVIDKVIQEKIAQENEIDKLLEKWQDVKVFDMQKDLEIEQPVQEEQEDPERAAFFAKYWEIDQESFDEYVSNNPDILANGYDNLYINKGKLGDEGTTIKTIMGEQVMIIDAKNNLLIVRVHTDDYDGRMAIIKDPRQVKVGCASTMGTIGQLIRTIAKEKGALLATNASGFNDPEWYGNGGEVMGLVVEDGVVRNKPVRGRQIMIGFDWENNLRIGKYEDISIFRDAVEFRPPLVLNGERTVEGSAGWGIAPRTAIGQDATGAVLLLVVDGRQVGHSIGATMSQLADEMLKHKAIQAAAVDGGSSSVMVYEGEEVTKSCLKGGKGRRVPNCFIVMPADSIKGND